MTARKLKMEEEKKVVAEIARRVMKRLREEVEKNGLKPSAIENGKEGKRNMIASCGFLVDASMKQGRRSHNGR